MNNQSAAYAPFLKRRQYAYRPKADNFFFLSLFVFNNPPAVSNLPYNLTFLTLYQLPVGEDIGEDISVACAPYDSS